MSNVGLTHIAKKSNSAEIISCKQWLKNYTFEL